MQRIGFQGFDVPKLGAGRPQKFLECLAIRQLACHEPHCNHFCCLFHAGSVGLSGFGAMDQRTMNPELFPRPSCRGEWVDMGGLSKIVRIVMLTARSSEASLFPDPS